MHIEWTERLKLLDGIVDSVRSDSYCDCMLPMSGGKDSAYQAPWAKLHGCFAGTLGDIGVDCLNYHKTIDTGEGGVVVMNDDDLADRVRLIRNHAEVIVKNKGTSDVVNLIGFNYRMGEIEAAIASEQLKKLEGLLAPRIEAADYLTERLRGIRGLTPLVVRKGVRHGY